MDDRSTAFKAVPAAFFAIALVTVTVRCYVRFFLIKAFSYDDGAMVLSMLFYTMFCACMISTALHGGGKKLAVVPLEQQHSALLFWWLLELAYCFSSVFCKISICLFLLRLTVAKYQKNILYFVIALATLGGMVFMFLMLLQCKPISSFWNRTGSAADNKAHCLSTSIVIDMSYAYSAIAATSDITLAMLPVFLVKNLQMRKDVKLGLMGILSMACVSSLAILIRFPYIKTLADPEFLFATVDLAIWSCIENGLGIIAANFATFRPLLRKIRGTSSNGREGASYTISKSNSRPRRFWAKQGGQSIPLQSVDHIMDGRADKSPVTVTVVDRASLAHGTSTYNNSSEEHLQIDPSLHQQGIQRTVDICHSYEVTNLSTQSNERVPREAV